MKIEKLHLVGTIRIEEWFQEKDIIEVILSELPIEIDSEDIIITEKSSDKVVFEINIESI